MLCVMPPFPDPSTLFGGPTLRPPGGLLGVSDVNNMFGQTRGRMEKRAPATITTGPRSAG